MFAVMKPMILKTNKFSLVFLLKSARMKFVPAHDVNGREKKQEFNSSEANTKTNKRWLDGIAGVNMK